VDASDRRIFVSYRRDDSAHVAGRLTDRLINRFGVDRIFMDVDSLSPGVDFTEAIEQAVQDCSVLLAIVGERWASIEDRRGKRRLDDPTDFVVLEIRAALKRDIPVIPVLVDNAEMPRSELMPLTLKQFPRRHAFRIRHESWGRDTEGLIRRIEQLMLRRLSGAPVAAHVADRPERARPGEGGADIEDFRRLLAAVPGPASSVAAQATTAATAVHASTQRALMALGGSQFDPDIATAEPAALARQVHRRLGEYRTALGSLPGMAVACAFNPDPAVERLLPRALGRLLAAVPSTDGVADLVALQRYPALLLSYAAGVAARVAGHEATVHQVLSLPAGDRSALEVLMPFKVVAPAVVDRFDDWTGTPPPYGLSLYLRRAVRPLFEDLLSGGEFDAAFDDYEYLRSLLELHRLAFSAYGSFAVTLGRGRRDVPIRVGPALEEGSALLRAGAFDGSPAAAVRIARRLESAVRARHG
jgi:hypothetical protein